MNLEKVKESLNKYQATLHLDSYSRRENLISEMSKLEAQGTDCSKCSGFCCTYYHNSMQVTPLEAIEILIELMESDRLNDETIERLKANSKKYRLDNEITDGHGHILRRYYTCPFFNDHSLGCSLSRRVKPYGCLAFNAIEKNVSVEGKCKSQGGLLEQREKEFSEVESNLNNELQSSLKLYWIKKPITQALLDMMMQMSI